MSEVHINGNAFKRRVAVIQKNLAAGLPALNGATSVLVMVGSSNEDNPYQKSTILQQWLLGYEFPATGILVTATKTVILTSVNKAKHVDKLKSDSVLVWTRNKDAAHNAQLFKDLLAEMSGKIGILSKDSYKGKFIDEWQAALEPVKADYVFVDAAAGLSATWELKDAEELKALTTAAKASVALIDFFQQEMVTAVDDERKITNYQLSEKLELKIDDAKYVARLEKSLDLDPEVLEWCYTPIVQSSSKNYDLKASAQSDDEQLYGGVVLSTLGLRYKSYCSNVGRTFLIDPTKEIEANYDFLVLLQAQVFTWLTAGAVAKDVYAKAVEFVREKHPELADHFVKNIGWSMGLEFRDSTFVLNAKNERVIHEGSVLNVTLGFQNLTNSKATSSKDKTYALVLTDTVAITAAEPKLLTPYTKARAEVSFYFKDDEDVKPAKSKSDQIKLEQDLKKNEQNSKILKSKLRGENKNTASEDQEAIKRELQKQLHEKRQKEGLARFDSSDATDASETVAVFKRYESYIRETQIPPQVRDLRLHVDVKNQTIILPICGRPVPFHINSYKNGSKNEEGDYLYLRLNFNSPGAGGNVSKKTELPYEDGNDKEFVRSFTFRSRDTERLAEVFKQISDLKKESVKRETEKKSMADVVTQAKLLENRGSRMKKLDSVFVRPAPDSKRVAGSLEIHQNGLRYQSPIRSDHKVDILFSNIKHLFFQPCKEELIVIIHCHLKHPIMIGKKKTSDVQFYREASDMTADETGGRKRKYRYGDEDELQQEQEERRRKALLDKEFRGFAELIADESNGLVDLDVPFRELGFTGVPFRSSVFCMPTRDCLIQLIDPPFMVVTLEEIEIAHLERVQFGLKNFDLVFVFKDFAKPVVHVNTIEMGVLEDVKSWLTDVDIPLSEGAINLNWPTIMKTVQSDPYQFFVDGGWSFLAGDDDEDESDEEEESEFEVSDEDPSDEEVVSEADDSDASADGSDSEGGSGSGSDFDEESEADDWDEMDRKAARDDARRGGEH
ncbi:hypothetical protein BABINDRAFT_63879 [Babjeviella inositovora NRRL Y-12698]|uniref:FACT complex subunit n=1 Tax=Babjeviella inositovora NRRL Y-12698 TaxID=984486 RepID=A0A1E3QN63_9ASCO|nr:uncharacterized protein BABINDRAFT_63879 [Babjeviella inositovora NRRL Y-12698]ODQ79146.1 hypothetical protein BABINDRAFT_63879 [Babjeviella inositovora NRRL Y-12698]